MEAHSRWRGSVADSTGCWEEAGFTFEKCCVPWEARDVEAIGNGNPGCWTHGFTYERCCPPPEIPRDFFSCDQSDPAWRHFREGMSLSRPFTQCGIVEVLERSVHECLLGGFLAALVHLHMTLEVISRQESAIGAFEEVFDRVARLFWLVLHSPLSLDEILASGWPIGKTLMTLLTYPRLTQLAKSRLGASPPAFPVFTGFTNAVQDLMTLGRRVRSDTILPLLAASDNEAASHPVTLASVFLATAYSLRMFDGPHAPLADQEGLEAEARRLLTLGYTRLKKTLRSAADPFSGLVTIEMPIASLLHGLNLDAVVAVDPLRLIRRLVKEYAFPAEMFPRRWLDSSAAALPRLDIHVLPYEDSVSNSVRAHRQPFCHDFGAFLRIIAAVGHVAVCGSLPASDLAAPPEGMACPVEPSRVALVRGSFRFRLWEVGANLGDCALWATAFLRGVRSEHAPLDLRVRGFEPAPWAAAAFRRSVTALGGRRGPPAAIEVRELALGKAAGTRTLGVPPHSWAESTFNGCDWRYHENYTGFQCEQLVVRADTVDRQLQRSLVACRPGRRPVAPRSSQSSLGPRRAPVDFMKIHVQGDELRVLRGAQRSLSSGLICVVLLKLYSVEMIGGATDSMASELRGRLRGFRGWLVDMGGGATDLEPGNAAIVHIFEEARRLGPIGRLPHESVRKVNMMLVAYHTGARCRRSLAVEAVRGLWGVGGKA